MDVVTCSVAESSHAAHPVFFGTFKRIGCTGVHS